MRTYWSAHGLAARGHEVHVVTNAKEARAPFRMYMRPEDWKRCEATYGTGSVTMHWSDPIDRSQAYIPMASPFVSKLSAIAASAHLARPFDVIYSHYLEPYGVAGHLAAQMTGVPHVVRMAGSDAGRLWHHPQLEALYDHVLRSAETVIAAGVVAKRAVQRGVASDRIVPGGHFAIPEDLFTSVGSALDLPSLRTAVEGDADFGDLMWGEFAGQWPYFGVYGKLGESKGSFALLAAMHRLKRAGLEVGLVALAHGTSAVERSFRARARKLGLTDRILQIPFLPHWRVPEFLRGSLAACCLEQDFPIGFHSPIIPREVLLCGTCLVGSTEVIRKLPLYEQLPDRYGCVAIEDVNDIEALAGRLAAIVEDPRLSVAVGTRGRHFARELQQDMPFPQTLERILEAAARRQRLQPGGPVEMSDADAGNRGFPLTLLAADAIGRTGGGREVEASTERAPDLSLDLCWARGVLASLQREIADGNTSRKPLVPPVKVEIAIAAAEAEADDNGPAAPSDPLFRLRTGRWGIADDEFASLVPVRNPHLRILEFDHDVSELLGVRTAAEFPATATPLPSYMVVFGRSGDGRREPLIVDGLTAQILTLSDGTCTVADIVRELDRQTGKSAAASNIAWIERLFVSDLIGLQEARADPPVGDAPDRPGPSVKTSVKTRLNIRARPVRGRRSKAKRTVSRG